MAQMMRRMVPAAIAALGLVGVMMVSKVKAEERETIEWCNLRWENTNDSKLPRVLLIGDSITLGYSAAVKKLLEGKANVDVLATSKCVRDPALLKEIAYAMEGYKHAVVHFNNGLHGWHLDEKGYETGLRAMVKEIQKHAKGAKLVWAATTPVPSSEKGVKLDEKRNGVVLARNTIAAKIMEENNIPINDLYTLVLDDLDALTASKGNVHYNEKGKERQAEAVVNAIILLMK
ncbi:MAG: SGNH/GDSL hydrolase family protein [Planctomycetota bacterium]